MQEMAFKKLVRFAYNGRIEYGDLLGSNSSGHTISRLVGDLEIGLRDSGDIVTASKLLCPLERTPLIICIGLNYQQHATEANLAVPKYPVVFTKPADSLAGPEDDISIHPSAQGMLDYEGELTVVIGRDAKNVPENCALDYVLGYTLGNDVSARNFQLPEVSGGQFCFAKSMDNFAPIGPAIVSTSQIPDPKKLTYTTRVNGTVRQQTSTDNMIHSIPKLISHLSQGTTLRKGTLIMTGTPSGVGFFMKKFLKDGDVVEVEADQIGTLSNKMVFEA